MTEEKQPAVQPLAIDWNNQSQSALNIIQTLAGKHGVTAAVTELDKYCDDMARLAGDDVEFDVPEQILANLGKLGIYDGRDLTRLHARYLGELAS